MNLLLNRVFIGKTYTIGHLYIDDVLFCDTLEDIPREIKIADETCIPEGQYSVILNYSNRFQRVMPRVLNVPNFDGILIHAGNNENNTSGCILVGKNTIKGQLTSSKETFNKLFSILTNAEDKITLKITSV